MSDSVFLDTSVIDGDYRLRSGNLSHLVRVCRIPNPKVKIIAPAVVLTDLISHYHNDFEGVITKTRKVCLELERYLYSGLPPKMDLKHRELLANYEHWLQRRSKNLGIIIRDYPKIEHKQIIRRASTKRKPFKDHDLGYKDTLIWESILEYLKETSDRVLFLSADQDFGESSLHQDLLEDLASMGVEQTRVTLFKDFESLVQHLYTTYDLSTVFEDEQRAQWASVTKKQLKSLIPFEDIMAKEKSSIQRMILVNYHLYTSQPQIERLVSLSDDIRLKHVDFTPSYTGDGVWKLDGKALITTDAEYRNLVGEEIQPFGRRETMDLEVKFIVYYDYSKEIIVDSIIRHVDRHVT